MSADPGGLNVVVVNDRSYPEGGASKVALQSAVGLATRGARVTVFASMGPPASDLGEAGVATHVLGQRDLASGSRSKLAVQGLWNGQAASELTDLLAGMPQGRTVVHIHSWSKALSPSVFTAAGKSGHPVFATLHDYGFACPNAALHDFPAGTPCERKPMSLACVSTNCDARRFHHKAWRVGRQFVLEQVARAGSTLVEAFCVTEFSRSILQPLLPRGLKASVLLNPINVAEKTCATPATSDIFTYVGRFSREKGVLVLAEAAAREGLKIVFVGDGELADEIRAVNPDAEITGWLSPSQVQDRIAVSRCVVVPSLWRETQGMVLPEAFAAGIPVIASSGTAPAAALQPGVTGLVFENGSVDSLRATLRTAANDDVLVASMGQAAYQAHWTAPPTLDRHVDNLLTAYQGALV